MKKPWWMEREIRFDRSGPAYGPKFPVRMRSLHSEAYLSEGEARELIEQIHEALGDNEVRGTCGTTPEMEARER